MKYLLPFLFLPFWINSQPADSFLNDFQLFKKALTETHPGLYRFSSEELFEATFDSIEQQIKAGTTQLEFFRMLSRIESLIREGHSYINPAPELLNTIKSSQLFPFEVWVSDEYLLITKSYSEKYNDLVGQEIVAINGQSVAMTLKTLEHSTGLQSAYSNAALKNQLSYSDNFAVTYALLIDQPEHYRLAIRVDENSPLTEITIDGVVSKNSKESTYPKYPAEKDPPFTFGIRGGTALLTITTFAHWTVSVDHKNYLHFFRECFKELETKQIESLIIDVRNNRGGEEMIAAELLSYFIYEDFAIYNSVKTRTLDYTFINQLPNATKVSFSPKHFLQTDSGFFLTNDAILETIRKKEKYHFDGDVYMLLNGGSRSATNTLLALSKSFKAATLIGTESGGAFEDVDGRWTIKFTLPYSKIKVSYPAWSMKINSTNGDRLHGVIPDILIEKSKHDLFDQTDSQLDYTLRMIEKYN